MCYFYLVVQKLNFARTKRGGFAGVRSRGGRARGMRIRGGGNRGGGSSRGQGLSKRKTRSQNAQRKEDDVEFRWNDKKRPYREFLFTSNPGVKVRIEDKSCALSILKTFLTDKLIDDIVSHTNQYAELIKSMPHVQEWMEASQRSLFNLWKDLTVDELWVYIGVQVLMGIVHKLNIHLVLERKPSYQYANIQSAYAQRPLRADKKNAPLCKPFI